MKYSGTNKWTLPIVATMALFIVFGLYMSVAVPVLEGKSASQIPKIDPLGIFKSESAGQWISLFSADSWQRQEENRNIIKADGNILVFQDYHQQEDGTLKVTRLCLLLFDKESHGQDGNLDLDGKHYPTVIEAVDGAVLSFDHSRPLAMGKYGELQEIQFLGQVQFWKESTDPEKVLFLQTHELVVNGQRATTHFPVQFRFGDSIGRAVGLDLLFKNPDLERTIKPAVTEISGIQVARFGNLQHVALKIENQSDIDSQAISDGSADSSIKLASQNSVSPPKDPGKSDPQEVELKCDGPAEFYFDNLYANFHRNVRVIDRDSGYQLDGELVQVLFAADPSRSGATVQTQISSKPSPFVPKGLKPQRVIAQGQVETGKPAQVSHTSENSLLTAAQLEYDLLGKQFVASAKIPGTVRSAFPKYVELISQGLSLKVPQLRYRPAGKLSEGTSHKSIGQVWAEGAGVLTHQQAGKQVELTWEDQFTLADDKELVDHKVFSVYGNSKVRVDGGMKFDADQIHFWAKSTFDRFTNKQQFTPDLLVASGNVRFNDNKMAGEFESAKIYFPKDAKPFSKSLSSHQKQTLRTAVAQSIASELVQLARPTFNFYPIETANNHQSDSDDDTNKGAYLQAKSLVMALRSVTGKNNSSSYEPSQIQLLENVSLIESNFAGSHPIALVEPGYHIKGSQVTGIAQGHDANNKPEFAWKIQGDDHTIASVTTPQITILSQELQFDQAANRVWSDVSGSLSFPLQGSSSLLGSTESSQDTVEIESGKGSLSWNESMSFDGSAFQAIGQVQCDIDQLRKDKSAQKIRANSQKLTLNLVTKINFREKKPSRSPQISTLHLTGSEDDPNNPVRLYQQEYDANSNLVGQEAVWAPLVNVNRSEQLITLQGKGHLWSVRKKKKSAEDVIQVVHNQTDQKREGELNHVQVEFDRALTGNIEKGQFVFSGPVHTIYGSSDKWRVENPEAELFDMVKLDCDQLTMNRWQISDSAEHELELDALGSVHVIGQQFESLAERLKYNRNQDLLTIEGDTRTAAKFWQDNPATGKRNEVVAQKIWYRPTSRWFNCEGFKGGDITFFAGQK